MKICTTFILFLILCSCRDASPKINREELVLRNNPSVTCFDSLSSFTVGNGNFAFTVDATGLQTFSHLYSKGVPLGTQSEWGWHSYANPQQFIPADILKPYDLGRGRNETYAVQRDNSPRARDAANWFRANPHRMHLGMVGLELDESIITSDISDIYQQLNMWEGSIQSRFTIKQYAYHVETVCHPQVDGIAVSIQSDKLPGIKFHFPYPSDQFTSDGCDWGKDHLHDTRIVHSDNFRVILQRRVDETTYYLTISWEDDASFLEKQKNYFTLTSGTNHLQFTCTFSKEHPSATAELLSFHSTKQAASTYWKSFWNNGGIVDFSQCKDSRARELERRVVLSQYLLAVQCAGHTPPQETGLTYNSWYGKFHLEMVWWHQSHFALWGHPGILEKTLNWYKEISPIACGIAQRQGFDGARWMKMTDPSGIETPSYIGSFLIWQQPHPIYLAELLYRATLSPEIIAEYSDIVQKTAEFMYAFATYDENNRHYILKGYIPAQERYKPEDMVNSPFEMCYWIFGLETAQKWRERSGLPRCSQWDEMIRQFSPMFSVDGIYPPAESVGNKYVDKHYITDHMSTLAAYGMLPESHLMDKVTMKKTLHWILENWNWHETWGWDYPMTAMTATRLGEPQKAIEALLMQQQTNTYLNNGHNYQNENLRIYLPGNGGLLTTIALMCAGWDGNHIHNPGFPADGNWNVRWEGLLPMP